MPMIVACAGYQDGKRIADLAIEDCPAFIDASIAKPSAAAAGPGRFVWIGLHEPDADVLNRVQKAFLLHPLAIEDALLAHQRPKIDVFGEQLFLVMRTAQLVDKIVQFGETHIFVGRGFVITVRHGASSSYQKVRARCEAEPDLLRHGEDFVLYAIMDFVVDHLLAIVDAVEPQVEKIEDAVRTGRAGRLTIDRIALLRRELVRLRHGSAPLAEICNRLQRLRVPFIDEPIRPYYADVHDHVIRVNESIDLLRDALSTAFETFLLLASNRQNEVMRQLAGWAAILAVPTAIAGIYGMNFEYMPELKEPWGYPAVLAFIAIVCVGLFIKFRRMGWL